jgi:hypothetical protein
MSFHSLGTTSDSECDDEYNINLKNRGIFFRLHCNYEVFASTADKIVFSTDLIRAK